MKLTKSKSRAQLTDSHLNDVLLLSVSSVAPDISSLSAQKQHQVSHRLISNCKLCFFIVINVFPGCGRPRSFDFFLLHSRFKRLATPVLDGHKACCTDGMTVAQSPAAFDIDQCLWYERSGASPEAARFAVQIGQNSAMKVSGEDEWPTLAH